MNMSRFLGDCPRKPVISIAGAGGKTSLMFFLAKSLSGPCIVTTTTKVGIQQITHADQCCTDAVFFAAPRSFAHVKTLWVSPSLEGKNQKISGFELQQFSQLAAVAHSAGFSIINEADGAAMRHLKAPAAHEPVIPPETNVLFYCCGLDTLGKPICSETVHRPEIYRRLTGAQADDLISEAQMIRLILHPQGGFKNCPPESKRIAVLNQADNSERLECGERISRALISAGIDAVWISCMNDQAKIIKGYLS